ncbi:hypothetical protein LY71_11243 [Geodermatophilus tzadiensis]|uniref:Uncharacterized protein n=1 Tax=Geodermatophilus tzadiensis TaxID=1137988 RepID=A0A2T0TQ95_9ACTN|nr:hypothetical protein [Geodermatophilus tzadiensis]PRY47688.1 hypothetical protein LY71_11243 [Geodermatophilus tzadiensis]
MLLRHGSEVGATELVAPGVEVEVLAGERLIVVRGLTGAGPDAVMDEAPEMANRALDLIAMRGFVSGAIDDPLGFHIAWWQGALSRVARVWSLATLTMTGTTVGLGGGKATPPPPPAWQESMRYFRMSQVTDDLFDAFRNVYLALESILDSVAPWRKGEGEGVWLRRALTGASKMVNLPDYLSTPASDPIDAVFQELYRNIRTATFHGKAGRRVLLPQDQSARSAVAEAKLRYARMYLDIAKAVFGSHFSHRGGLTPEAFKLMINEVTSGLSLALTDDAAPVVGSDTDFSPNGRPVVEVPATQVMHMDRPYLATVSGTIDTNVVLSAVGRVRRAGALFPDGRPAIVERLEAEFDPSGFDELELVIATRARNGGAGLRQEYAT